MEPDIAALLTELVEKIGLLRRDMLQKKDLEKYEARFARIEQKFSSLADPLRLYSLSMLRVMYAWS